MSDAVDPLGAQQPILRNFELVEQGTAVANAD